MGYFSNGTEGECYYEEYCSRCIHNGDGEGPMCAVWTAHLLYSYDLCNEEKNPLNVLIPRSKDRLYNERCKMFIPAPSIGFDFTSGSKP